MLETTPLNALHREAQARMVDFGGWDMPVHYGSQIEEHHAVRKDAGMFDVSHMRVVDLVGQGVRDFLRAVLANDVAKLTLPGKALYGCMLNERGGVIDDLITYFFREDFFRLVVNASTAKKDIEWLRAQQAKRAPGVRITPRPDLAIIAVQGPQAIAKLAKAFPATKDPVASLKPFQAAMVGAWMVARTGYTGEDGVEIVIPAAEAAGTWKKLQDAGVRPAGLGARDTLRLEAGMNLYGQDMTEDVSPLDAGLAWTVDLKPGRDFVGRAALERAGQKHQFLGLLLIGSGGVLRAHQKVKTATGEGETTSGTFSPTLTKSIALARLPLDTKPGDTVHVIIRDKPVEARVVKAPFVRNGKPLVS